MASPTLLSVLRETLQEITAELTRAETKRAQRQAEVETAKAELREAETRLLVATARHAQIQQQHDEFARHVRRVERED